MALDLNYKPTPLVDTATLTEDEWLAWRRKGIGGSDVASALGLSPYRTARELYFDKIGVSFAWSAYSCIVCGYPQEVPDKLITLQDACKEDGVSVHITTSEYGMCFCEDITCDETGELHVTCEDMTTYRCKACGAIQSMTQWDLPEEQECCECGNIGFELIEEEQKTEKMEVISHGA